MRTNLDVVVAGCDSDGRRQAVAAMIRTRGYRVIEAGTLDAVAPLCVGCRTLVVIDDVHQSCDWFALIATARRLSPTTAIVFATDRGAHTSTAATRLGAVHVVSRSIADAALAHLIDGRNGPRDAAACCARLVGCESRAMGRVLELAAQAGARDCKVLITGETGVGKEVVARLIHDLSRRTGHPFVAINCGAVPETLLESQLFGHVRGSFTDAIRDRPGLLQNAHGGTVFLDELGEMAARTQALLLRFLESGEIQRVGELASTHVDARVIAATNRDLDQFVREGRFREDLFYRIRVLHVHVPPLRERREDIRPLFQSFARESAATVRLTSGAWSVLEQYAWPGNVRQLRNVVEQLAVESTGAHVDEDAVRRACGLGAGSLSWPARDRRRRVADDLFRGVVSGQVGFWSVSDRLIRRTLVRQDVRDLIALGLAKTAGSYRELVGLFRLPNSDYRRFIEFLNRYDCSVDFRPFRQGVSRTRRLGGDNDTAEPVH